jgi:hypothetical protein
MACNYTNVSSYSRGLHAFESIHTYQLHTLVVYKAVEVYARRLLCCSYVYNEQLAQKRVET